MLCKFLWIKASAKCINVNVNVIVSIIHLDSLCFVTGEPLVQPPKHTQSYSDCLKGAKTRLFVPTDWPSIGVCEAAIATT